MNIEKNRNSWIELLRIISMVKIITLHYLYSGMGGALGGVIEGTANYYLAHWFESTSVCGVNVFVLITVMYSGKTRTIRIDKLIRLYGIMVFWGGLLYFISLAAGLNTPSIKEIIYIFIPFLASRRWFVITYLLLVILIPYLNIMIDNISKRNFKILCLFQLFFFSIWSSFLPGRLNTDCGYGIINFITLYLVGSYIMHYWKNINRGFLILTYFLSVIGVYICSLLPYIEDRAWNYDFIFNISAALSLVLLFKSFHECNCRTVNIIGGTTFSVFLLHTDFSLADYLWKYILKCQKFYTSNYFVLHLLLSVTAIFAFCSLLEVIRRGTFNEKWFHEKMNKISLFNINF